MSTTQHQTSVVEGAKPCPFCGGTRILYGYKYAAICVDCGATGPDKNKCEDAKKAWNTRSEKTQP